MLIHSRTLAIASSLTLALASASTVRAQATAAEVRDARQESQIWTTFALNPYLQANDLSVSVQNGKATLTGRVEEGVSKELAKQIALGVSGVKEVDNQIVVQPDYVPKALTADRTFGEAMEDATITSVVKSKLMWSTYTDGMTTNVETNRGRVTLQGTSRTAAARDLAMRLALNTRGVILVDNQIKVDAASPRPAGDTVTAAHEAEREVSDSWITAKVKSTFRYSSNVNGYEITVNTRDGIVTLSGKLGSDAECSRAVELAQNVRGVKAVHFAGLTS